MKKDDVKHMLRTIFYILFVSVCMVMAIVVNEVYGRKERLYLFCVVGAIIGAYNAIVKMIDDNKRSKRSNTDLLMDRFHRVTNLDDAGKMFYWE